MNQFDMVTTQWAFVGPAIILPQKLGFGTPSGLFTTVFFAFLSWTVIDHGVDQLHIVVLALLYALGLDLTGTHVE